MIKEFLQNSPDWVYFGLHLFVLLLASIALFLFVKKVGEKKSLLELSCELSEDPEQPTVNEKEILEKSRYVKKKASRYPKDVDRYGRWSLTLLKDNTTITRIGFLYTVLRNLPPVKHYREIK